MSSGFSTFYGKIFIPEKVKNEAVFDAKSGGFGISF